MSVVLRPDQASAMRLELAMDEVAALAGPRHFRTGIADSLHITGRALEGYREAAAGDERVNVAGAKAENHYCERHGGTP